MTQEYNKIKNMKIRPLEDDVENTLLWSWDNLIEYLNNIEDYLQKATEQFEARINEQKKKLTSEKDGEFEAEHADEYAYYYDEFRYILRNSFLISAYSLFENNIGMICKQLKDNHKIPISWNKLKGDELERAKNYYKLAGLDLTYNNTIWNEITRYTKIRNCIVHNNSFLKEDDKDYKDLVRYIKHKGLLKSRYITTEEEAEQEIGLTKEFCKEFVDNMKKFVIAAYEYSIKKN